MHIILIGGPGAGKGTQAKALSSRLDIPHISTGDMIREAARKKLPWGIEADKLIRGGNFVPDNVMIPLITHTLGEPKCDHGFILDGFPRNIQQAHSLTEIFSGLNINAYSVVNIDVSRETIVERLTSRRSCSVCGGIVSLRNLKAENICPVCGAEDTLVHRNDDNEEVILKRIGIYNEVTHPLIEFYSSLNKLVTIDGNNKADKVTRDILSAISAG